MIPTQPLSALPPGDRRTVAAFAAVLPPTAPVELLSGAGSSLVVGVAGQVLSLLWLGRAGVRQVRQVIESPVRPDVIVGTEISGAARKAAAEAGLGWVDESGSAEILASGIVVSRQVATARRRDVVVGWTPSVVSVAEAILSGVPATVAAASEATGHVPSATARALKVLVEMGLLAADAERGRHSGRRIVDEDRLLDAYAAAAAEAPTAEGLRCGAPWRDPIATVERLGQRWATAGYGWAATGMLGAAVVAPYLSDITNGEVYVDAKSFPELLKIAEAAGLEPIDGGRLLVRPFPTSTSLLLASTVGDLRVVPWPRLYADLRQVGVRGEEAAEHLREVVRGS